MILLAFSLIPLRVDLNASATQDITPRFPLSPYASVPVSSAAIFEAQLSPTILTLYLRLLDAFPSGTSVFHLFRDTAFLASLMKARLSHSSLDQICEDTLWSWEHLYPLVHNLLSYRVPVQVEDYESVVKESCKLALSIFTTKVRRQFGMAPLVLDIYVDQMLLLFQGNKISSDWGELNEFKLWVLVVGAMEARGETRAGLSALLTEVIHRLDIRSHLDLLKRMKELIWVKEIDGEDFLRLEFELREFWAASG